MTLINNREKKRASEIKILDKLNPEEGLRIRAVNVDLFDLRLREMEFGINVAKRIVYLDGGIEPVTLFRLKQQLDTILDTCNEEDPISIYINSYGGDVHAMFGIIDLITNYPVKINTTAIGAAMSAGAWILMSGTGVRAMSRASIIMFHEIQSEHHGTSTKIESTVEHTRLLQNMTSELIYSKTSISKKSWLEMLKDKQEIFFDADECLKYGIVDKIL